MNRRTVGIVAAIALAAIGTFVLVAYVRGAEDRAVAGEKLVSVVIASKTIDAGTAGEDLSSATRQERVPAKARSESAITSLKDVRGLVTATDLVPGEQLLRSRFAAVGEVRKGVGSVKVPAGYVEITLSLEPERAVGGLIKAGSKVVAIATASADDTSPAGVIAHQVLVTNVQLEKKNNEPSEDETKTVAPTRNLLVTVAVDDGTAGRILTYAQDGSVWLGSERQVLAGSSSQ